MKKTFNVTIAVEVESEMEIERIDDIAYDVYVKSKNADTKVLFVVDTYEV